MNAYTPLVAILALALGGVIGCYFAKRALYRIIDYKIERLAELLESRLNQQARHTNAFTEVEVKVLEDLLFVVYRQQSLLDRLSREDESSWYRILEDEFRPGVKGFEKLFQENGYLIYTKRQQGVTFNIRNNHSTIMMAMDYLRHLREDDMEERRRCFEIIRKARARLVRDYSEFLNLVHIQLAVREYDSGPPSRAGTVSAS